MGFGQLRHPYAPQIQKVAKETQRAPAFQKVMMEIEKAKSAGLPREIIPSSREGKASFQGLCLSSEGSASCRSNSLYGFEVVLCKSIFLGAWQEGSGRVRKTQSNLPQGLNRLSVR